MFMIAEINVKNYIVALAVGLAAFFIDISAVRFETLNGQPNCDYIDAVAMLVGFGLLAFGFNQLKIRPVNPAYMLLSVGIAGLGIVHLLRSVGYITGPCA